MSAIIEVAGVSKSFGGVKANTDISMTVAEGGITGLGHPSEQGGLESLQDVGGERGQQRSLVGEMARRCPVRNAGPAGEAPQAESSDPILPDRFCGLLEEDLTKVPVVIGLFNVAVLRHGSLPARVVRKSLTFGHRDLKRGSQFP